MNLPSASGFAGSLSLTAATIPAGTSLDLSYTDESPAGLPASLALARRILDSSSPTALFVTLSVSNTVALTLAPTFTFTVASGFPISGQSYYLAFYDGTQPQLGWQAPFGGPATFAGDTLTITAAGEMTFQAGVTYAFALYAGENGPTPSPGAAFMISVPTPAPILASNSSGTQVTSVTFASVANSPPQTLTLSQAGYGLGFTATTTNSSVATAAESETPDGDYVVTITPTGVGTCTIDLTSENGGTGSIGVSVTGP